MKTIAVIEDEPLVRENIIERLTEGGYHVISAENGMLGIELISEHRPDLVICDIMMPNLGGFGVLEYVRKDPTTELIPFIFLTALSESSDLRKGMVSGADDYLTKPFSREDLLNAVEARLQKKSSYDILIQEKLDGLRDSLNRSLPHEFLTPLNSILGLSDLLHDHKANFSETETQEMLRNINQAGQRLLRLVQNYLRFAELESMRHDAERRSSMTNECFDYADTIIREIVDVIGDRSNRCNDITVDVENAVLKMHPQNFEKLVEELVDNACKFSLENTPIVISGRTHDGWYELEFRDRGRGITERQITCIGAYVQFDRQHHEQRGVGLGLAIVHLIVELHGGHMHIDSETGRYTTVTLRLPLATEET